MTVADVGGQGTMHALGGVDGMEEVVVAVVGEVVDGPSGRARRGGGTTCLMFAEGVFEETLCARG